MLEPIEIYLAGRATAEFGGVKIPVEALAVEASREWLSRNIRFLDPEVDVRIVPRIRPTSSDRAPRRERHPRRRRGERSVHARAPVRSRVEDGVDRACADVQLALRAGCPKELLQPQRGHLQLPRRGSEPG